MHRTRAALGAAILAFWIQHGVADARPITLAEAIELADRGPDVAAAAASVDEARGNLEQAGKYNYNPTLGLSAGWARAMGATYYDFQVGLTQGIELGGKRGARRRVAGAERDSAEATLAATKVALHAEVRRTFYAALVGQERVKVTAEAEAWAREFREAALERQRLGAATQTEVNVAVANLGRAVAAKKAADRDLLLARNALGDVLGVVATDLDPSGTLPTFAPIATDENAFVTEAVAGRRDLTAMEHERAARGADVELADANAVPDPEVSIAWSRDAVDGANAIVGSFSIALPVWNRNQGNRHAARAALKRATVARDAFRMGVERDVRTALRRYQAATDAVAAFDQQIVGKLGENLTLAREAFAAGKLGLLDVNTVRRDLVESQNTYLDAIAEAVEARAALEVAIGRSLEGTR